MFFEFISSSGFYKIQANRALRQATLGTLNSLIVAYGDKIVSAAYEVIIVELSTLIRFLSQINIATLVFLCGLRCLNSLCQILILMFVINYQWFGFAHDCTSFRALLHIDGRRKGKIKHWLCCKNKSSSSGIGFNQEFPFAWPCPTGMFDGNNSLSNISISFLT